VNKKETDISLIRKYLNGELNAHAMHKLERRAQDDPFLMDAIEGYEKGGSDQQTNLDLLALRLQQRIISKEKKIIPWSFIAIAASMLIVFTVGGLLLFNNHPAKNTPQIARQVKPEVKAPVASAKPVVIPEQKKEIAVLKKAPHRKQMVSPSIVHDISQGSNPAMPDQIANADIKDKNADNVAKDTTPLNEMVVMSYEAKKKKDATAAVSVADADPLKKSATVTTDQLLQGRVAGVTATPLQGKDSDYKYSFKNSINGMVIAKDDGLPVPGASVRIAGTNKSAVTGVDGKFSIPVDSGKKNRLIIANIGYQTREINTGSRDSLKTIALEPNNSSLSEVVVTGYTSQKKNDIDNPVIIDSHPNGGWSSFRKYLKEKAVSPDRKTGVVKLSFMVDHSGIVTDIKVIKGLGSVTDQKAIDLINNGPGWIGSTSGRTEKVTVRIKFVK
jgi:CarboxypepD_reg-like domain/Gram-negative bacterial TonB protein C-terminal